MPCWGSPIPGAPESHPRLFPGLARGRYPPSNLCKHLLGKLQRLSSDEHLHFRSSPDKKEMHPPALPVEQPVLVTSVLVVFPVNSAAPRNAGLNGIEIREGSLASKRLLTRDERQQSKIDQTLSKAPIRNRPDGLHKRERSGRFWHENEDRGQTATACGLGRSDASHLGSTR